MKNFIINEQNVAGIASEMASWIKEKVRQAHCQGVVLGMSGGIDCSVTARLCQLAGVDVQLVMMPYGDDMQNTKSLDHAMTFIEKFNFPYHIYDIRPAVDALTLPVDSSFYKCHGVASRSYAGNLEQTGVADPDLSFRLSSANIRPRVRMTYLYHLAQADNRLVIGTGNLSERTVGYFTKWGDGACDLNPLAKLTKQEVYTLARYLEIPDCIINKKPSAGLWEGQTDEDELGITYTQIDAYILNGTSGHPDVDRKIEQKAAFSAHKRAPIPVFE